MMDRKYSVKQTVAAILLAALFTGGIGVYMLFIPEIDTRSVGGTVVYNFANIPAWLFIAVSVILLVTLPANIKKARQKSDTDIKS